MKHSILRLRHDQRGIAAVEFALIAPVLVAFYLGAAEFCQGYMAQKRMGHVASMVADLTAQTQTVTPAALDDIFQIGALIMKPFPTSGLQQRVSNVTQTDGVARVVWSRGQGMSARRPADVVTLPPDLIVNGQSVIMTEATYDYDSPVDYLMPAVTHFSQTYYLRPRVVDSIACATC